MKIVNTKTKVVKDVPNALVGDYLGTKEWRLQEKIKPADEANQPQKNK